MGEASIEDRVPGAFRWRLAACGVQELARGLSLGVVQRLKCSQVLVRNT
jgi:hypothetical protein